MKRREPTSTLGKTIDSRAKDGPRGLMDHTRGALTRKESQPEEQGKRESKGYSGWVRRAVDKTLAWSSEEQNSIPTDPVKLTGLSFAMQRC